MPLSLVPLADEPEAAAVVDPWNPVLDKAGLDRREINRKAVKHFSTVRHMLADHRGKSLIMFLGPNYKPNPENYVRYGEPRLAEFNGCSPWPNEDGSGPGAWQNRSTGHSGKDVISLVEYLGQCDRKKATDFLRDLTDRLVELLHK
jgi:hypothetical protein